MLDRLYINRLKIPAIVGIHPPERSRKQDLYISVELELDLKEVCRTDDIFTTADYGKIADLLIAYVSESRRYTIETLADDIARICHDEWSLHCVNVHVDKPYAHSAAESMAVRISRQRAELDPAAVVIGMGSNQSPETHLPAALERLHQLGAVRCVSGAFQFEDVKADSAPCFVNAAVQIETILPPLEVRRRLKLIEADLGRSASSDEIPIDLDLCLYGNLIIDEGPLKLPSANLNTAAYLAHTVSQLSPPVIHPESGEPVRQIASRLVEEPVVEREEISQRLQTAIDAAENVAEPNQC